MRTCSVRFRLHVPFTKGRARGEVCFVEAWEIPLRKPAGNRTPCGEARYGVENARGVHVFFVGGQTQNVAQAARVATRIAWKRYHGPVAFHR